MKIALTFLVLLGLSSCKTTSTSQVSSEKKPSYEWWKRERETRDAALKTFLKAQGDNYESFWNVPVGYSGVPVIMFRAFPEVFPDIWNEEEIAKLGFRKQEDPKAFLPFGLAWGMGSTPLVNVPGLKDNDITKNLPGVDKLPTLKDIRMQVVNLSCAGCHNGRVYVNGEEKHMVGAPSTTFDINAYRRKIVKTVNDPRYTHANFKAAITKIGVPNIYSHARDLPHALVDFTAFQTKGDMILQALKEKINEQENKIINYLGEYSYKSSAHLLHGGALGMTDAFGIGTARILPNDLNDLPPAEKQEKLAEFLPVEGAMIDYAAIWNQGNKPYAQWDGSLTSSFIRNIAPAIGVIGDPMLVNMDNTKKTTVFVEKLPSPPYPFDIDSNKIAQGQAIFEKACAQCHGASQFVPLAEIGTDPARAAGFMKKTRELLLGDIKKACDRDMSIHPDCKKLGDPDKILIPTYNRPGYLAPILDGIWARAPYLHNGSVPTLYHLLIPSERPDTFVRGNINYDQRMVGFVWDGKSRFSTVYDTKSMGFSNKGHDDPAVYFGGIDFKRDQESLMALLEYMKTL